MKALNKLPLCLTLGIIEFMRIILCVILALTVSSCTTSYKMTSNELKGLNCLESNESMYLYRDVDTCPLLSLEPRKSDVWRLGVYDKFAQQRAEESKQYDYKLTSRSCEWPTLIGERIILGASTKFYLEGAYTTSDTINSNRLFLEGTLDSGKESIRWRGEVEMNEKSSVRKRILSRFNICKDS